MEFDFLYDETENPKIRYVSFAGDTQRFDLAVIYTEKYYGKPLVLDLQKNRFAIIGHDDLEEPGYLEHAYQLSTEEAEELKSFLYTVI
ncbi:Protein of unknown function [Seinonella peptonophila]|uniref:DUF3055 domain-containing protein n=1 Tax=Seinonella peptonophila TaxID=112248 RepID=A0A1M4WKK8_9BACL|nr:DUF3055 domain-containing protein [Seinonella peptonophila]SHE81799.1 Protein of unknown function [Seinonella peptonophila]